jgi:hypothetical protein
MGERERERERNREREREIERERERNLLFEWSDLPFFTQETKGKKERKRKNTIEQRLYKQ